MLRLLPLTRSLPSCSPCHVRGLVSSALLTKSWQKESIVDLRSEAKRLGLSAKGSKSSLASRIEEYERASLSADHITGSRQASSSSPSTSAPTANPTKAPGNPEPPVVPNAPYSMDIQLPDLSQRAPLPPVQPPFVPDFWDSSSPVIVTEEEVLPKMVVIGGADTHHGGGPTHSSLELDADDGLSGGAKSEHSDSFLDDVAKDLGLPPVSDKVKGFFSFLN